MTKTTAENFQHVSMLHPERKKIIEQCEEVQLAKKLQYSTNTKKKSGQTLQGPSAGMVHIKNRDQHEGGQDKRDPPCRTTTSV